MSKSRTWNVGPLLLVTVLGLLTQPGGTTSPQDTVISLADADLTFEEEASGDWAGYSTSPAGDVNNDGFADIVIGAPFAALYGKAYLVLGRARDAWPADYIVLSDADASFLGCTLGNMTGRQNYTAGDVNGDGYDDLLVSGWKCKETQLFQGKTFLFLGRPTVDWGQNCPAEQADASFLGEAGEDWTGYYVSTAGDVNADGYDDMLITSPQCTSVPEERGQVYLILGRAAADWGTNYPLALADASFVGEDAGDRAGRSATGVGDVNGDGYDDVLIGSIVSPDGGAGAGESWLILGRPAADWGMHFSLAGADASFVGESAGDESGRRVAWAGDVNGDGLDDMTTGASRNEQAGAEAGKTYLILGRTAADWGMDFSLAGADAAFLGESSGDQSGRRVAGAGDVNADGYDDLLIGAPHNARGGVNAGAAYLVYGRPGADWGGAFPLSQADVIYVGEGANHFSGYDVARAGDMDGDGTDDLLIGAYAGKVQAVPGRAYVIYGTGEGLPQPVSFTPDGPQGKVGEWHSFTTAYSDPNGWSDIESARLLLGTSIADLKALNVLYEPAANALYLRNGSDTAWLGPCTPGTNAKLTNNIVQLDCRQSTITHSGDELQVVWRGRWIQRTNRSRSLTAHLRAADQAGHDSGFVPLGTWMLLP